MTRDSFDEQKRKAIDALTGRAWLEQTKAQELVDVSIGGAVEQALDTITGATLVAATMTSMRAERLYYICRAAKRWLGQREVEVLFRVTPTAARSIMATAQATYEGSLSQYLVERMRTQVQPRDTGTASDPTVTLRCPDASSYNTLMNEVHRLTLDKYVEEGPGRYDLTFPEQIEIRGKAQSLFAALGILKPKDYPNR
jgi:hypothetical protein